DAEGMVKDASITVRKGEIVGIDGLVGAGKTEFCKTVFGGRRRESGSVRLNGKELKINNPSDGKERGMVWVASLLKRPSDTQLIGDSMVLTACTTPEYVGYQRSQIVYRYNSFDTSKNYAVGLRHGDKANVGWFDGHVNTNLASELRSCANYCNHFGHAGGIYQKL
ncbi:MAG: ATP-binding cassette domain-containing protein, partial [Victivallales bacterium]|nr:ATP-binding cassette domain-containing protein [Victivallales bacterium]